MGKTKKKIYEAMYVGPFAEESGVKYNNSALRRILPHNQWVRLKDKAEYNATREIFAVRVRQRFILREVVDVRDVD